MISKRCIIAFLLLNFLYSLQAQNNNALLSWISSHKNASSSDIENFLQNRILTEIKTTTSLYEVFDAIIQTYPEAKIPVNLYARYASFAALNFDFAKAANMYERAYEKTKNINFLIKASIQLLEMGEKDKAFSYMSKANEKAVSHRELLFITIAKATALIEDGQSDIAYALLSTLPFNIPPEELGSFFYYLLYQTAERSGNTLEANKAHQTLTEKFPYSIEIYMLNSPHVHPLPLPSKIFSLQNQILQDINTTIAKDSFIDSFVNDDALYNTQEQEDYTFNKDDAVEINFDIHPHPNYGYQVASFTSLDNAKQSLKNYYATWNSLQYLYGLHAPVITQKPVFNKIFYQIIFPFSDDISTIEKQNNITMHFRAHNIDGFLVTQ